MKPKDKNQIHEVNDAALSPHVGREGVTYDLIASAASFVRHNSPEAIALRLAEFQSELNRLKATVRLINIASSNTGWASEADLDSIEWALNRKLNS